MAEYRKRWLAAAAVFGIAILCIGSGVRFSAADEPKAADLADLRDAVKSASKRGENVDAIAKALDALEKVLAGGWKAKDGDTNGPPELQAVRQAAEAAGRKGENVEEIIKQLEAVEKKWTGRVQTVPQPVPPPLGDPKPDPRPRPFRGDFPIPRAQPFVLPDRGFGGGGAVDREALQKAMDLRMKAMELLLQDANDPKALELAQQATEMMLKAIGGGRGILAPELMFPDALGRVPDRVRLGVRMERPAAALVEQLGLEAGRGIAIVEVIPGTPAEKAGFKTHDIVLEFDGKPVSDIPEDFNRQVTGAKGGVKLTAVVLRKGKKVELKEIELPQIEAVRPEGRREGRPLPLPGIEPPPLPGIELPVPEARPLPIKPLPRPPIGDRNGRGVSGTTTVVNGNFTIKSQENGVQFELKGTTRDAGTTLTEVVIDDNGTVHKADSLEKVPEQFRPTVERLLKNVGGRPARKRD